MYGGYIPGAGYVPKKADPKCDECKRLLAGIDRIAHSQFHWQALAQARLLLHANEDDKS